MENEYNLVDDLLGVDAGGRLPDRNFLPSSICLKKAQESSQVAVDIINEAQFETYAPRHLLVDKNNLLYERNQKIETLYNQYLYPLLPKVISEITQTEDISSEHRQLLLGFINHGEKKQKKLFSKKLGCKKHFTHEAIMDLIKSLKLSRHDTATLLGSKKKPQAKTKTLSDPDINRKKGISLALPKNSSLNDIVSSSNDDIAKQLHTLCEEIEKCENGLSELLNASAENYKETAKKSFTTCQDFSLILTEYFSTNFSLHITEDNVSSILRTIFFETVEKIISHLDHFPGEVQLLAQLYKVKILSLAKPHGNLSAHTHDDSFYKNIYFSPTFIDKFLDFIAQFVDCANQQAALETIIDFPINSPFTTCICEILIIPPEGLTVPTKLAMAIEQQQPDTLLITIINYYILKHCCDVYPPALAQFKKTIAEMGTQSKENAELLQQSSPSLSPKRAASSPAPSLNLSSDSIFKPDPCATPRKASEGQSSADKPSIPVLPGVDVKQRKEQLLSSPRNSAINSKGNQNFTYLPVSPRASEEEINSHQPLLGNSSKKCDLKPLGSPRATPLSHPISIGHLAATPFALRFVNNIISEKEIYPHHREEDDLINEADYSPPKPPTLGGRSRGT